MPNRDGKDTRYHSNRKVTKEALGNRYAEIGVGFGDDPRVQKDIAEQQAMWGKVDPDGGRFNGPTELEEEAAAGENMHEPNDDIGSYDGHGYESGY